VPVTILQENAAEKPLEIYWLHKIIMLLNFGPLHQRSAPLRLLGTFYSSRRARKFMSHVENRVLAF
jgi:hypothetical protein